MRSWEGMAENSSLLTREPSCLDQLRSRPYSLDALAGPFEAYQPRRVLGQDGMGDQKSIHLLASAIIVHPLGIW